MRPGALIYFTFNGKQNKKLFGGDVKDGFYDKENRLGLLLCTGEGEKRSDSRALDGGGEQSLMRGAGTAHSAGNDFTAFLAETLKMDFTIKKIDAARFNDINIPNEPFSIIGKLYPEYNGTWNYHVSLYIFNVSAK